MTKDEKMRAKVDYWIEHMTAPELAMLQWQCAEVSRIAAEQARQPVKTGRLPEAGDVAMMRMPFSGRWDTQEVKGRRGDAFWFGDCILRGLEAEGITWRWPEPKGDK